MKFTPEKLVRRLDELIKNPKLEEVLKLNSELDEFFYGVFPSIEKTNEDLDAYIGLSPDALLTPYLDYYKILKDMDTTQTLIDLGSGYSRGTFLSEFLDLSTCYGIEYIKERVNFSKNRFESFFSKKSKQIQEKDLSSEPIISSDAYFLYFPKGKVLNKVLFDLLEFKNLKYLYVIESHGDVLPMLKNLSFLEELKTLKTSIPRHNSRIYKFKLLPNDKLIDFKNHPEEWIILNWKKGIYFEIELFHKILNDVVLWLVPVSECFIESFDGRAHINFNGRLIDYTDNEPLAGYRSLGELEFIKNLSIKKEMKKILKFENAYYIENKFGVLEEIQ